MIHVNFLEEIGNSEGDEKRAAPPSEGVVDPGDIVPHGTGL